MLFSIGTNVEITYHAQYPRTSSGTGTVSRLIICNRTIILESTDNINHNRKLINKGRYSRSFKFLEERKATLARALAIT